MTGITTRACIFTVLKKMFQDLHIKKVERDLKVLQEKIVTFSSGSFDSRIEIHTTVYNRQVIYEGNLSLIEAFRFEAGKS